MRFTGSKLLITMGITAALVLGTTACTKESSDTATVVCITDGDTLVASMNGKDHVIRLLNIDTPETKDPSKAVECLGAEATEFLRDLLPVGAKITLEYDVERTDKYNRTLAAAPKLLVQDSAPPSFLEKTPNSCHLCKKQRRKQRPTHKASTTRMLPVLYRRSLRVPRLLWRPW